MQKLKKAGLMILLFSLLNGTGISQNIFPFTFQKMQLSNGLTAYLVPVQGSGLVAYYSVVRTGSRDEWEPGKSGFAHFFEHIMFKGTPTYPGGMYDKEVTKIGADANAYTTDDYTCYHLNFPSEFLEKVVELESDRFQHLTYSEQEFKTESGAVYGEYRKGRNNPFSVLEEEVYNLAFDRHTYKHTTIGFEADIKNMPNMYDYSLSFFKRYYRPENVVLMVVGDFKPAEAKKLIEKYYAGWKSGYVPPRIKAEPPQKKARFKKVKYAGRTNPIIWMGYKNDAFHTDNRLLAAAILFGDLAFGETSDFYKEMVLTTQKIEFIEPYFGLNRDPNLFNIITRVNKAEDIQMVMDKIQSTIDIFSKKTVDIKKLEDLKKNMKYGFAMGLDTPDNIAGRAARYVALTGRLESINEWYATLMKIEPEDILEAVNKYFVEKGKTTIILEGGE